MRGRAGRNVPSNGEGEGEEGGGDYQHSPQLDHPLELPKANSRILHYQRHERNGQPSIDHITKVILWMRFIMIDYNCLDFNYCND